MKPIILNTGMGLGGCLIYDEVYSDTYQQFVGVFSCVSLVRGSRIPCRHRTMELLYSKGTALNVYLAVLALIPCPFQSRVTLASCESYFSMQDKADLDTLVRAVR